MGRFSPDGELVGGAVSRAHGRSARSLARRWALVSVVLAAWSGWLSPAAWAQSTQAERKALHALFQTSDRCFACHNGLVSASGEDVSIALDWASSIMANSSRDPYWQASVRRETIDHAPAQAAVQDECTVCHMPMTRYAAKSLGRLGQLFANLPFDPRHQVEAFAVDGVSCSVCHQITPEGLGQPSSYNGGFHIGVPSASGIHPEFGPFDISGGRMRIMRTSTGGFEPNGYGGAQIRSAELCATCHTLITQARGAGGKIIGALPEQMPYPEWLHSDYAHERTCQSCHMPEVAGDAPIARVLGVSRAGLHRHEFVAANFFIQRLLAEHPRELAVAARPVDLSHAANRTLRFLQSLAARVRIDTVSRSAGRLLVDVTVINSSGHKLPTAFPSRRAWLHFRVDDRAGRTVFDSGALNLDGSIRGNDNDIDATRFEPFYREITSADQVQIYEDILGDAQGRVTTGLLSAVRYLKDDRLLPRGFDKRTAEPNIAVVGAAASDPGFRGGEDKVRYSVDLAGAPGPYRIDVELWYQPIGYRWAKNLEPYRAAPEPRRFTDYFDAAGPRTAALLASARATWPR